MADEQQPQPQQTATHLLVPLAEAQRVRYMLGQLPCDSKCPDGATAADLVVAWRTFDTVNFVPAQVAAPAPAANGKDTAPLDEDGPDLDAEGDPLTHTDA